MKPPFGRFVHARYGSSTVPLQRPRWQKTRFHPDLRVLEIVYSSQWSVKCCIRLILAAIVVLRSSGCPSDCANTPKSSMNRKPTAFTSFQSSEAVEITDLVPLNNHTASAAENRHRPNPPYFVASHWFPLERVRGFEVAVAFGALKAQILRRYRLSGSIQRVEYHRMEFPRPACRFLA